MILWMSAPPVQPMTRMTATQSLRNGNRRP
jgi:hypothetical protein